MRRVEGEPPAVCGQCGGEAFRPARRREQLVRWFTHGAGAGAAWYCSGCSASWSGASSYHALYRRSASGWRRWVRLPFDVLAALRHARSWQPVPVFYAAVGGVALVPATVVAALTRARWWMAIAGVPLVAMVGTFLWSLATAAGRGRRDVLWRLAPERAWPAELEEELAAMRAQIGGFELLVPRSWPGALSLEGGSWSIPRRGPRVMHEVRVIADQGDPQLETRRHLPGWRPSTPRVEIHATDGAWPTPEDQALREFVERAFPPPPPELDHVGRHEMERRMLAALRDHEQQRQRRETELTDRWRDGHVQVDGVRIAARLLTHEDTDVGIATFTDGGRGVMLIGEGIDLNTLTLVRLADPHPFVDVFEHRRRRTFTQSNR